MLEIASITTTEREEILNFHYNRLLLRSMLALVRFKVQKVVKRHKIQQMVEYRKTNLAKFVFIEMKNNVRIRRKKK
jgi:hypothetical protein